MGEAGVEAAAVEAAEAADESEDCKRELQPTSLNDLSDDCLISVLSRVDGPIPPGTWPACTSEVLECALVCKRWARLASHALWRLQLDVPLGCGFRRIGADMLVALPRFQNLRQLALRGFRLHNWCSLFEIFQRHCPRLQALVLSSVRDKFGAPTLAVLCESCPALEVLILQDALDDELELLPTCVFQLQHLRQLTIVRAVGLLGISSSVSNLTALRQLELASLPQVNELPDVLDSLASLESLVIRNCLRLRAVPGSLSCLPRLRRLVLNDLDLLDHLPDDLFSGLSRLEELQIAHLPMLQSLPSSLGALRSLRHLAIRECRLLSGLPPGISGLAALEKLDVVACWTIMELPEEVGCLTALVELRMAMCTRVHFLPESLGQLSRLEVLDVSSCYSLEELPSTLGGLQRLRRLSLQRCENILELPQSLSALSSLSMLNLVGCTNLLDVNDGAPRGCLGRFGRLEDILLCHHGGVSGLPQVLRGLGDLRVIQ